MTTAASLVRIYLRASTESQNAERAKADLMTFATQRDLRVVGAYIENESGAKLDRPELFRALADSQPGDILLVEQIDRLSRLTASDWQRLRAEIDLRGVKIVALDLPTSWQLATTSADDFTARMFGAINSMLLDMLAAISRKDYEDRRRRAAQGIERARAASPEKYKGRPEDTARLARIAKLLDAGMSYSDIVATTKASRATIAKVAKRMKEEAIA